MRALTWQGNLDVQVTDVPDPRIQEPTDAVIAVTSTAICGSDLHLYGVLGPYLSPGDVLGHEAMGVVTEVGADVTNLTAGDRVVIPFNISCGHCWMCHRGLYAQCETTQVREQGKGAALFGYTSLYGSVPGGQAQFLRVPQAQFGPVGFEQVAVRAAGPERRGEPAAPAADVHHRPAAQVTVLGDLPHGVLGQAHVERLRVALLGQEQAEQPNGPAHAGGRRLAAAKWCRQAHAGPQ